MKHFILLTIFLLTGLIVACQKFVEVGPPTDQLVTESVFQNNETAISAVTGLYARMVNNATLSYNIALHTGVAGDELFLHSNVVALRQLYLSNPKPLDAITNTFWENGYYYIYRANGIIEGLEISSNVTTKVKNQLTGEALFVRAFWHFYLLNLYGDIPLILTTDYGTNSKAFRSPVTKVYEQIVLDLVRSKTLLNEVYVAANSETESTDRVRPNSFAASALLARVYLYTGNHNEAEKEATRLIEKTAYYELEPATKNFLKASKEAIWQLMMPTGLSANTYEALNFTLTSKPALSTSNCTTLSSPLLTSFENTDLRKLNWVGKFTDKTVTPNVDYFFPAKYKASGATITEHSIVFRLAEMFLIRAEARANLNNLPGAIADLDVVRGRAGVKLVSVSNPSISKEDLITFIFQERQRELFAEWGHRWMDMKRSNRINAIMAVAAPAKGGVWTEDKKLLPIPQNEIENDKNIIQNPSYN